MHRILYYSGIFTGSITFIISYGSKKRWSVDAGMQNKTMPLRKTGSGRLFAGKAVRKINDYSVQNKHKEITETVLLENYHGQELKDIKKDIDFEIIEEINLIAGGR